MAANQKRIGHELRSYVINLYRNLPSNIPDKIQRSMARPNTRLPKDTIVTITGFGWLTICPTLLLNDVRHCYTNSSLFQV